MKTKEAFDAIAESSIFRLEGEDIDLCESIITLCDAIKEDDETDWSIGEGGECSLDDLIIGAHWALSEWHAGQNSIEYAALCATDSIFSPGMSAGPEPESGEQCAYELINEYFKAKVKA